MMTKYPASYFIKMAMQMKNISMEELSKLSSVPLAEISSILNNQIPLTSESDTKIAPVLGFPISHLLRLETIYLEWKMPQDNTY